MKIEIPSNILQHHLDLCKTKNLDLGKPKEDAEKLKICNNRIQLEITKESRVSKNLVKYPKKV